MVEYGKYNMEAIYPDCLTPAYPLCHLYHHGMFSSFVYKTQQLLKKTDFTLIFVRICYVSASYAICYEIEFPTTSLTPVRSIWKMISGLMQVLKDVFRSAFQRSHRVFKFWLILTNQNFKEFIRNSSFERYKLDSISKKYQVFKFWKMLSQHLKEDMKHSNFERFYQVSISNML